MKCVITQIIETAGGSMSSATLSEYEDEIRFAQDFERAFSPVIFDSCFDALEFYRKHRNNKAFLSPDCKSILWIDDQDDALSHVIAAIEVA